VAAIEAAAADVVGESAEAWLLRPGAERYLPDLLARALRDATGADAALDQINFVYGELHAGEIRTADVHAGRIDHAIGLSAMYTSIRRSYRWPAQRGDSSQTTGALQEGIRLRLPPGYVPPASLTPVARMIAIAARDYGFVIWDRAGALGFRAEPGVKPYFNGVAPSRVLDGFPWSRLQVLKTGSDANPDPTR
jgi:hypothetical protein